MKKDQKRITRSIRKRENKIETGKNEISGNRHSVCFKLLETAELRLIDTEHLLRCAVLNM